MHLDEVLRKAQEYYNTSKAGLVRYYSSNGYTQHEAVRKAESELTAAEQLLHFLYTLK